MSSDGVCSRKLLRNVHEGLEDPETGETWLVRGDYDYWHYACEGFRDQGWGCGYRTLQTIASWIRYNTEEKDPVPSIPEIQRILVAIEDKEASFTNSKGWIGSFEVGSTPQQNTVMQVDRENLWKRLYFSGRNFLCKVCLVLDQLYNITSKIIHISRGKDLAQHTERIKQHFAISASPIMMGGDKDCSSKGIVGIHIGTKNTYLLVVDPHFVGRAKSAKQLQNDHWVKWQNLNDFVDSSFYNICLPQYTKPAI